MGAWRSAAAKRAAAAAKAESGCCAGAPARSTKTRVRGREARGGRGGVEAVEVVVDVVVVVREEAWERWGSAGRIMPEDFVECEEEPEREVRDGDSASRKRGSGVAPAGAGAGAGVELGRKRRRIELGVCGRERWRRSEGGDGGGATSLNQMEAVGSGPAVADGMLAVSGCEVSVRGLAAGCGGPLGSAGF